MIDKNKVYEVTNRSGSYACYEVSNENGMGIVNRTFAPGETKKLTYSELEQLSYIPGGLQLIQDCLLIKEEEILEEFNIRTEPEYFYTPEQIIKLMKEGSLDEFLDCLDFAPEGVIQIIKDMAVVQNLNDIEKREAILEKTGFDVSKAIANKKAEEAELAKEKNAAAATTTERRVKTDTAATGRRTDAPKYTIINKE